MLAQAKPKNARSKRALDKKAPHDTENTKTALFLRGQKTSNIVNLAAQELRSLKKPFIQVFSKDNEVHPFEDASSLEFFSSKNDTSLLCLSIHSKKRPHCLTLARTFDYKLLDMLELYIDPETFREMRTFKTKKCASGLKPMIAFHGTVFESPVQTKYTLAKSLLLDFFRGQDATEIDVEGLQYLISISAEEEEEGQPSPQIHFRVYTIKTMRSGQKLPRVEVQEMGPRLDFRVGREKFADDSMLKEALKKPKGTEARTKKNIETDIMGDKVGKVHVGKQDLSKLQTRKMKGLKRGRDEVNGEANGDVEMDGQSEQSDEGGVELPTPKKGKF